MKIVKGLIKSVFLFILVFGGAGIIFLFIASSSPKVMQSVVKFGANTFLKDITVEDLAIERQICDFPRQFTFQGVSMSLKQDKEAYQFSFETIQISKILDLISSGKGAVLDFDKGSIKASVFRIDGLKARLASESMAKWSGPISVSEAESNGFLVTNIRARAVVQSEEAVLSDIIGDSYEGKITGKVIVSFLPVVQYNADIAFRGLVTERMESVNPSVFSQIGGRIYGTIEAWGPAGGLETIQMDMSFKNGGEIQAKLLEPLLPHIPKSTQRENIKTAIEENKRIHVDNAQLQLGNKDDKTISTDIKLKSDDLNLDVNVTVDFILEDGLQNLIKNFKQLSNYMKGE